MNSQAANKPEENRTEEEKEAARKKEAEVRAAIFTSISALLSTISRPNQRKVVLKLASAYARKEKVVITREEAVLQMASRDEVTIEIVGAYYETPLRTIYNNKLVFVAAGVISNDCEAGTRHLYNTQKLFALVRFKRAHKYTWEKLRTTIGSWEASLQNYAKGLQNQAGAGFGG